MVERFEIFAILQNFEHHFLFGLGLAHTHPEGFFNRDILQHNHDAIQLCPPAVEDGTELCPEPGRRHGFKFVRQKFQHVVPIQIHLGGDQQIEGVFDGFPQLRFQLQPIQKVVARGNFPQDPFRGPGKSGQDFAVGRDGENSLIHVVEQ